MIWGAEWVFPSILLAEKYDAQVFAADLWSNRRKTQSDLLNWGLEEKIIPLHVDATKGRPFVKKKGFMAVAVPGFIQDFPKGQLPEEIKPYWEAKLVFLFLRLVAGIMGKRTRYNSYRTT